MITVILATSLVTMFLQLLLGLLVITLWGLKDD